MAIRNFKNRGTEDINYGRTTKEALRILPKELHKKAQIKLARLGAATSILDLKEIRGNRFKKLLLFTIQSQLMHRSSYSGAINGGHFP